MKRGIALAAALLAGCATAPAPVALAPAARGPRSRRGGDVGFEVATPSMLNGTAFWTIRVKTAKVGPTPMPAMNIQDQTIGTRVSARSWVVRAVAMPMRTIAPTVAPSFVAADPSDDQNR